MPIYYPRMYAKLTVPVAGTAGEKKVQDGEDTTVSLPFIPRRAQLESNDHNHADSLRIVADWRQAGVDPRLLSNATCEFYMGNAKDPNFYLPPPRSDLRFVGVMTRPRRIGGEGQGLITELEFLDYTQFFLEAKIFPDSGVPDFTQDLEQAWARICDHTGVPDPTTGAISPTVGKLRNRLVLKGGLIDPPLLSKAVGARFARLGKVHVKPNSSAWDVWQQTVGMLGLISYIYLDECIVTSATDYYTAENPPRLVWGQNIDKINEERDPQHVGTGVGITSFDPLTGTTLEALWPPVGSQDLIHKKLSAKRAGNADEVRRGENRTYFAYPGVTNPDALVEIAKRAYEEMSRQEMEGTLATHEMSVSRAEGIPEDQFDLLTLKAGDVVRIELDEQDKQALANIGTEEAQIAYLLERGYEHSAAELIAKNVSTYAGLQPHFYVKRVHTTLATDDDAGSFDVEINYCNRIDVSGNAIKHR
jgi:hypothetical protein